MNTFSISKEEFGMYDHTKGFHNFRIKCQAKDLLSTIDSLANYDDGQGRKYDILDEEISDTEYHYQD